VTLDGDGQALGRAIQVLDIGRSGDETSLLHKQGVDGFLHTRRAQ
jgi:hypothetical protein